MAPNDSFEQEIKKYLQQKSIKFFDRSSAYDQLDFTILKNDQPAFHFDAKEKRQTYNLSNWPKFALQTDLFILDDLAVRKCLAYAPKSGILIRDNLRQKYFFFSIIDLALMPRLRVNRQIHRNQPDLKGKWLINLRNGKESESLDEAIKYIRAYLQKMNSYLFNVHECYGDYVDENIDHGGIVRRPTHWDTDVQGTR
jgi:hypothetical protein